MRFLQLICTSEGMDDPDLWNTNFKSRLVYCSLVEPRTNDSFYQGTQEAKLFLSTRRSIPSQWPLSSSSLSKNCSPDEKIVHFIEKDALPATSECFSNVLSRGTASLQAKSWTFCIFYWTLTSPFTATAYFLSVKVWARKPQSFIMPRTLLDLPWYM